MDEELAHYFFEEASSIFAFLVTEHSFAPPQLRIDDTIDFAFVMFVARNLAVECILDEREAEIDCKIARVAGGKSTSHYAVDDTGMRVRDDLASLLRRRGITGRLFQRVEGQDPRKRIRATLQDFASMLRQHGHDILSDSPSALM